MIITSDREIFKQEVESLLQYFFSKRGAIFHMWDDLNKEGIPVQVDVEGFHVEIDSVNQVLFALAVIRSSLLLVVLVLQGFSLLKWILVV